MVKDNISIDIGTVNAFILGKQHLTGDSRIGSIVRITKDVGGLHATSPTTPYLSLFARMPGFKKDDLYNELSIKKTLGKIRCMRKTVFILPKKHIPAAYIATKSQVETNTERFVRYVGVTPEEYHETSNRIMLILKGKGMTTKEIKESLQTKVNISAIINLMCDRGILVRGSSKSGWKSNAHEYHIFAEYFPDIDLGQIELPNAKRKIVEQYISSFGPVSEADIAWWTGFTKKDVEQALDVLSDRIATIKIRDIEGTFIILSSDMEILNSLELCEGHNINFLPSLDPYIMGYKERERYLDYERYYNVFDRSGNATNTILLDGEVIGVWDFDNQKTPLVKLLFFKKIQLTLMRKIEEKAEGIGQFIAGKEVEVKRCDSMTPLPQRTAGSHMSPLKDY